MSFNKGAHGPQNASPECKAEVDRRAELCLKDPAQQKVIAAERGRKGRVGAILEIGEAGPHLYCADAAFLRMLMQRRKWAEDKREAAERRANAEKTEMPKAAKRDPALEKQIAAAYKAEYPKNKILKVVLVATEWSTERSSIGLITGRNIQAVVVNQQKDVCELHSEAWQQEYIGKKFTGKLAPRGAGSQQKSEILCSKVK